MKTFKIDANAISATYEAANADAAVIAYVNDAGYATVASAAEACGQTEDEFLADLHVEQVECH